MKVMAAFLLFATILVVGCDSDKPKASNSESAPLPPAAGRRPETRGLEAIGIIGYDGVGMRRSIDNALNQNDAQNAATKKAIDQTNEQ